jgi:hypothetical protein
MGLPQRTYGTDEPTVRSEVISDQRAFFLLSVTGWESCRSSHCGRVPEKDLSPVM